MTTFGIIKQENEEFMIIEETIADTQKKIKQWLSTGYQVTLINQLTKESSQGITILITTLLRRKLNNVTKL